MTSDKFIIFFICTSCFCWSFFHCDRQPTQKAPVIPPPLFVQAVADTAIEENGIDAIPDLNAIYLQWQQREIYSAFQVYRSQDTGGFSAIATLNRQDTSYIDVVPVQTRFYYYLRARDDEDNWSAPSDTMDYLLLDKATNLRVIFADSLEFHWQVKGINPPYYVLRLFEENGNSIIWLSLTPSAYQGPEEKTAFNRDGRAKSAQLISGHRYRWRIDCIGTNPNSGSESNWQYFFAP